MKRLLTAILLGVISGYQRLISPLVPRRCKYEPTCSAYAVQAIRDLGPIRGTIVAGWRLLRCNPLSDGGIDDLEDRSLFRNHPHRHHPQEGRAGAEDEGRFAGAAR